MRPKILTMKAFGSYAKETVVDFDKLSGGLYLIVGKTGAGKTTIFDAISFALFGEPSGSEREAKTLHSDFVPLSEDTVVELTFEHSGKQYHVKRTIHFKRSRETGEYNYEKTEALLTGEEMAPVEKAKSVTSRCVELLGMNGDQFRRIVMLAQGEFRKFMKADGGEKKKILGDLFDSTEYVRYQSLIKAVRDDLYSGVRQQNDRISNAMKDFSPPDGEEESDYLPGNPHLEDNLRGLAERSQTRLNELQTVSEQWNVKVGELNKRKGAAETNNALFVELAKKRARLDDLASRREYIAQAQKIFEAAEKAQHGVKTYDDARKKAQSDYDDTLKKIALQKELLLTLSEKVRTAEEQVGADEPLTKEKEGLTADAKRLSDSLPDYRAFTQKEKAIRSSQKSLQEQKLLLEGLSAQKRNSEAQIAAMTKELEGLEGCGREEERLKLKGKTARSNYDAVAPEKENSVSANVYSVLNEEKILVNEGKTLAKLAENVLEAKNSYDEKYEKFISGQAGLIALDMERELAEKGETFCPVCKTRFHRGEEHCFAGVSGDIPSKAEVDKAEKAWKSEDKKYQDKQKDIDRKRIQLEERKSGIVRRMNELGYDSADWNTLVSPGYLDYICEERRRELDDVISEYKAASKRVEKKAKLEAEKKRKSDEQELLAKQYETKDRERQQSELELIRMKGEAEQIRKQLSYENEAEANKALDELKSRISELQIILSRHEDALKNARETAHITEGAVKQLEESVPHRESALQKARNDLAEALKENSFDSYEDYLSALATISGNPESWLKERQKEIDAYYYDLRNTKERAVELQRQTEGKEVINLAGLSGELAEAQKMQAETEHSKTEQYSRLSRYQSVLKTVEDANKELARLNGAFSRMDRLAGLATGTTGTGGKLSFDSFVMGAIFREVLEMANRRLDIMTGGRFQLIHKIEADRDNSIAGLGMEVRDMSTGKQRPSETVSGGEGFMVSLALALGLSDVVQSHAGGKKLDTLFIDEGFGTLDDGKLDNVIQVLQQLTEGNRLVGIISHVDKLEESIPQKLRVSGGEKGSTVSLELS